MSYETPVAPSLLDLIGRAWTLPGPVREIVFSAEGGAVAFLGEGRLAIAPVADPERPESRMRRAADTGRQTILPRKTAARPTADVEGLGGPVAPWGAKSFVAVSTDGGLVSITPRGQAVPLAVRLDAPPTAFARDPASLAVAIAGPGGVMLLEDPDSSPRPLWSGVAATALAFAPDGRLAAGFAGGVALLGPGGEVERVALDAAPSRLSWSPDGAFLAAGFVAPGFALIRLVDGAVDVNRDYPTAVASFAWSRPAGVFATSGAFRASAWSLTPEGLGDPVEAGRGGLVVVDRVAASPDRPLLAAGYASGLVCLNRIGGHDEMLLRAAGGAVTALAWSTDGGHLAFGDADGAAVLVAFPPEIFK